MDREFIYVRGESPNSWRAKEVLLRDFGTYMRNWGFHEYMPEVTTPEYRSGYVPHICTKPELRRFEDYPASADSPRKKWTPSCSVFYSEALNLKVSDYDCETGAALIRQGKNNRDRIVALHPTLMRRMNAFSSGKPA